MLKAKMSPKTRNREKSATNIYEFISIGTIHSCFKEKFGIPRQSGLVPEARAILRLQHSPEMKQAVRNLDGFSHIWVIFVFHSLKGSGEKHLIRPPRLGGNKKVGVFASRAPHRPNPIGISAVELERIDTDAPHGPELHLKGVDLLDGTPVLDIKPYVAYADALPNARAGWADQRPPKVTVEFSEDARQFCAEVSKNGYPNIDLFIEQMLRLDPRPAFQTKRKGLDTYAVRVLDFDVHWRIEGNRCEVTSITDTL